METKHLKRYAPEARQDFIESVTNKAAVYGLLPDELLPMQEDGDVVIIGDRPFPRSVAKQRKELEDRIRKDGFQQFIEAIAYTWFNRFVAIRYMELHGYLDHGYRVLSHPEGKSTPEILDNAERIELPGMKQDEVVDLKLDGGKDEQLYQMLLLAQCNALHKAMPFLFETIKDGTELLLPDNLLHTDSLVRTLVKDIPEEQWENVEIIGWLYQFYISEKKDEVIGKVVKSEDIPAATQLFTPNWIVKYLVQNSLGRQWVATYPDSPLKQQMEFYIEPAEQTPEVQQKLDEITPDSLNPEELTLLDPACGSGHILVEAYDLFKAIYTERGYRPRDIPKLILNKNLYGLEIDDRAAQLAAFALMMKARHDDRGIFGQDVQPNVLSIQESKGLNAKDITDALNEPILVDEPPPSGELFEEIADEKSPLFSRKNLSKAGDISQADVAHLIELFEHGKTFGSLIQIPKTLSEKLPAITQRVGEVAAHGGMFEQAFAKSLFPIVQQAQLLQLRYDAVVANPPYMGGRNGMNKSLKAYVQKHYADAKADLCCVFIKAGLLLAHPTKYVAMVTMQAWMFLSSFERFREDLLSDATLESMAHLGARAFGSISGEVVQVTAFSSRSLRVEGFHPSFFRLIEGGEQEKRAKLAAGQHLYNSLTQDEFLRVPGCPLAYYVSQRVMECFEESQPISDVADARQGLATSDNEQFVRQWWEVAFPRIGFSVANREEAKSIGAKWFPYNKDGTFRKWYGNVESVVNWENDGEAIKSTIVEKYPYLNGNPDFVAKNPDYYFRPAVSWTDITTGTLSCRLVEAGCVPSHVAHSAYFDSIERGMELLALMNTPVIDYFASLLSPTLHFDIGYFKKLPFFQSKSSRSIAIAEEAVQIARVDWNESETSWGFSSLPLLDHLSGACTAESFHARKKQCDSKVKLLRELEEENNRNVIALYGLEQELRPEVLDEDITLYRPDREEDNKRLISYSIGCMMGRYSLDEPGLIYADSGNAGFDASRYSKFPADDDGIIPITETAWFPDDASNRFEQFVKAAWPEEHLEENLTFVAECLGKKKNETSRDCIRRYLATGFYKHHLAMYKKRPIYWLFSSGKQRAFQCLVYLHRYNAGTLSRMRTEYVVKLQGKINSRIDQLEDDIPAASSTSHRKKLEKERDTLIKQREELQEFDEKLRHYADQRIELDLDDGVKVNYGKFGDLLAEVKPITGKKPVVEVTT